VASVAPLISLFKFCILEDYKSVLGGKIMRFVYLRSASVIVIAALALSTAGMAQAQETDQLTSDQDQSSGGFTFLDDVIVVTGTKKAGGENVQDAALAITAYGSETLDALQVRDISSLSFKMPNVALDEVGTTKGVANFAIRGLGVNSSIPSIDPAVGVFVDGVYLGINGGVVFDTFDLESVEVLRGPQGILFGRNVTGGAVLLNTADPKNEFQTTAKLIAESGLRGTGGNYYAMGTVTGPIVEDKLSAKLALYYNKDDGWFKNTLASGETETFGESETVIVRAAIKVTPNDIGNFTLKFEHGEADGQGPANQNHINGRGVEAAPLNPPGTSGRFSRESFDFSIDELGFFDTSWNQVIATINVDVNIGDGGSIVNVFGWREYEQTARSDIDGTPLSLFHGDFATKQNQISNELRFNGRFGDMVDLTTGIYYFSQKLVYTEGRDLLGALTPTGVPALTQHGGGIVDQETFGVFAAVDIDLTDSFSINAGIRYADETKDAQLASLVNNVNTPCNVIAGTCAFDFVDIFQTSNWSPKIGIGYEFSPDARMYAHWARAYRAGGFNLRNTAADKVNFGPGPFQDEQIDSFELGFKSEPMPRSRLNFAVFYNQMESLQREILLTDPIAGIVQVIRNTADATIWGVEIDGQIEILPGLLLEGSLGYVDGDYKNVVFDLNGDGVIDTDDASLQIPRLANWTGNIGLIAEQEMDFGTLTGRVAYSHRDGAALTDNNLGFLNPSDRIDASVSFALMDGDMTFTLYGKNLTNDVQHGGDTLLPDILGPVPLGGTLAPLSRGRTFGIELRLNSF
jgi:iron complex outermembrane recepter protein